MWSYVATGSVVIRILLQAAIGLSSDAGATIITRQAKGTLSYVAGSAPPKFEYTITQPYSTNWIGFFLKGSGAGVAGDKTYKGWSYAPDASGQVTADQSFDNCLPAAQFDAYFLREGDRDRPIAGPVLFDYPGNPNYKKCDDQCIASHAPCNGQCPSGQQVCGDKCCNSPAADCDLAGSNIACTNGLVQYISTGSGTQQQCATACLNNPSCKSYIITINSSAATSCWLVGGSAKDCRGPGNTGRYFDISCPVPPIQSCGMVGSNVACTNGLVQYIPTGSGTQQRCATACLNNPSCKSYIIAINSSAATSCWLVSGSASDCRGPGNTGLYFDANCPV